MATYIELRELMNDSTLQHRVATAVVIAAQGKLNEPTPTSARKGWASRTFAHPLQEAKRILKSVLAANSGASVAAIQGATDASIQTNVDDAIDMFIDADAGV